MKLIQFSFKLNIFQSLNYMLQITSIGFILVFPIFSISKRNSLNLQRNETRNQGKKKKKIE